MNKEEIQNMLAVNRSINDMEQNFRKRMEDLQQENQRLKEQKENLQNIVCNKIMTDYDIETPLKDELSKQILKNTVLEESKNITEHILDELEKWLKEIRNECFEIYSSPITQDATREFYYIDVIDKTLNKLQELKGSDNNE